MIYNLINSKNLIGDIYDMFNIKSSDFEDRFNIWVAECIQDMKIYYSYLLVEDEEVDIVGNAFVLPVNCMVLEKVKVNDTELTVNNRIVDVFKLSPYEYFENNRYVCVKANKAKITYRSLPIEKDCNTDKSYVLVPDHEHVKEAIRWFIMKRLLYRGYKHPVINLDSNNPYTNAGIAYDKARKKARSSAYAADKIEMKKINAASRTAL